MSLSYILLIVVVIYVVDFTLNPIDALGNLAEAFLVVSLPLSTIWASQQSEQTPVLNTSLSSVTENSSRIIQKFRFLQRSKDRNHEDVEKALSPVESATTNVKREKTTVEVIGDN